jgi:hypothetical protein
VEKAEDEYFSLGEEEVEVSASDVRRELQYGWSGSPILPWRPAHDP